MKIVHSSGDVEPMEDVRAVADAFDPTRLTQARHLAGATKRSVAEALRISPTAVGQWESGATRPRPDHIEPLASLLGVPPDFFSAGRPYARVQVSDTHFRSLRSTPAKDRNKAIAFVEQTWEVVHALEKRVRLPEVDVPGLSAGEVNEGVVPSDPEDAARFIRALWGLGEGPIPRVVRLLEAHGVVVTLVPFAGESTASVDAFSTSRLPRPVVVLTPDRARDVHRHRFTAAHELGHLLLHGEVGSGDPLQEREADRFAAEFLVPGHVIRPTLPARMDLTALSRLSAEWGVSVDSLIYRCHEIGSISEATYRRAFQRLNQLRKMGLFGADPVSSHPGERPVLLGRAFALAESDGLSLEALAREVRCSKSRLRAILGDVDPRPALHLVQS